MTTDKREELSMEQDEAGGEYRMSPHFRRFTLSDEIRELYPIYSALGPLTTRQRRKLHDLCDVADELYEALVDLIEATKEHVSVALDAQVIAALRKARGYAPHNGTEH